MNLRSNAHCHTVYCDGKNTPEEMIRAALERNFVSLGFSIHGWTPYEPTPTSIEREAEYRAELRALREKYRGRIEILIGAERDFLYERDFSDYEYLIDSAHCLERDGEIFDVDWSPEVTERAVERHFGGDYYAYCRAYYEQEARLCEKSDAAFIGHIDLVSKFNEGNRCFDESDPRYLGPAMEAVEVAVRRGKPIEMNTGAISRGYRTTPYPNPLLLRRIRELGGEIIINSDAHEASALDVGFDLCVELARSCGFDHVLRLRSHGFEEVGLVGSADSPLLPRWGDGLLTP